MKRAAALDTVLQPNGRAMSSSGKCSGLRAPQAPQVAPGPMFHSVSVPPRGSCARTPPAGSATPNVANVGMVEPVTRQAAITRSFSAVVPSAKAPAMITRQTSLTNFAVPARAPDVFPKAPAREGFGDAPFGRPVASKEQTLGAPKGLEGFRGRSIEARPGISVTPVVPPPPRVTPRSSCGGLQRPMSQPILATRLHGPPLAPVAPVAAVPPKSRPMVQAPNMRPGAPSASGFQFAAPYRQVVMCGSMQVPLPCQPQRQPAGAGAAWRGSTLWAEIDRRYPVTPLVHDIVEEALHEAPEAFQAPELRRDLKPRLRAVILEALSGGARPGLMLQNPNDRVILGVVLHNAEAWRHFARAARRQSAQSGLSRDLAERFLEAVRLFLGLEHQPEESPEKFWDLQPERPLHPIDDLAPLLCSRSTWQQEELPPRRGLIQEPITMSEALRNGYPGTSPSSTLDFAWLPAGQSPSSAEFKERTVEALLQLPGVHARACDLDGAASASRVPAAYPVSHRSPKPRQRAGQYDHVQARIDTNLPESAKSSPRSSRSPRQRSSSPRVTKLLLPTGSNPGSPRGSLSSRGSGLSPRRPASTGAKSQQSMEEQLSKELSTSSRPRSARSNRSQRSQSGQFRQPAPWRN